MSVIGDNIMKRRKEVGLTQEELALRLGYKSKSTINKIELGINDIPQSKVVMFAEALQTTPAALMGWLEEMEERPVEMAERHFEIVMDEDINDIFDDFRSLSPGQKKIVKDLVHNLAQTKTEA